MAVLLKFILSMVIASLVVPLVENHIVQRSPEPMSDPDDLHGLQSSTTEEPIKEICVGRTPCGWAVYHRVTRFVEYFMKNKCKCPEPRTCARQDEDISIYAYVYRCIVPTPDSKIENLNEGPL